MAGPKKRSVRLTKKHAEYIWQRRQDGLYQHQIAAELGVNQGRVSEVLSGHRFPDARPTAGGF